MPHIDGAAFGFDPATLMVHRPTQGDFDAVTLHFELVHERAHWYQFSGSTFGTLLLTSFRAEDIVLLLLAGPDAPAHGSFRAALEARDPLSPADGVDRPADLQRLVDTVGFVRRFRNELLNSRRVGERDLAFQIFEAIIKITYLIHTGYSPDEAAQVMRALPRPPEPSLASEPDASISTVQILEGHARLAEWTGVFILGWNVTMEGGRYEPIADNFLAYLGDAVRLSSDRYVGCMLLALEAWSMAADRGDPRSVAQAIGEALPTLACCFDIALNPQVAPLANLNETACDEVRPNARFIRAVEAVKVEGLLAEWPSDEVYEAYRDRVCDRAGLAIGVLEARSFQHERFTGEFWCGATTDDPLVWQTSYFDYAVWATERMHEYRSERPLQWAIPGISAFSQFGSGADVLMVLDQDRVWSSAPLHWSGDEFGAEARLSVAVGLALAGDVMGSVILRATVGGAGEVELFKYFPKELLEADVPGSTLRAVIKATGWSELSTWNMRCSLDESESVSEPAFSYHDPVAVPAPRTVITVSRAEVESVDVSSVRSVLDDARHQPLDNVWFLDLRFSGYDADPRGLWDIASVVEYVKALTVACPFWPWYLRPPEPEPGEGVAFLLCCLAQFGNPRRPDKEEIRELIRGVFGPIEQEMDRCDDIDSERADFIFRGTLQAIACLGAARLG